VDVSVDFAATGPVDVDAVRFNILNWRAINSRTQNKLWALHLQNCSLKYLCAINYLIDKIAQDFRLCRNRLDFLATFSRMNQKTRRIEFRMDEIQQGRHVDRTTLAQLPVAY
jgi:hypothetical protein